MESGNVTGELAGVTWTLESFNWNEDFPPNPLSLSCHQLLCFGLHVHIYMCLTSQTISGNRQPFHYFRIIACFPRDRMVCHPSFPLTLLPLTSPSMQQRDFIPICFCPLKIYLFRFLLFVLISLICQNTTAGGIKSGLFWTLPLLFSDSVISVFIAWLSASVGLKLGIFAPPAPRCWISGVHHTLSL